MAQATLATIELSAVPAIGQTRLFINNEWVDSLGGKKHFILHKAIVFDTHSLCKDDILRHTADDALCDRALRLVQMYTSTRLSQAGHNSLS